MAAPLDTPVDISVPFVPAPPRGGRGHPRFFLPEPSPAGHPTSSSSQPSRRNSLHSVPASSVTSPSTLVPSHRRTSLAQLRNALQMYHVRSPPDPVTPPPRPPASVTSTHHDVPSGLSTRSVSVLDLREHGGDYGWESALAEDRMDALVEIHRVLYRGREDLGIGGERRMTEEGQEVRRVVERWFEGDCEYDHPLLHLGSRQSLLAHIILLHLVATMSLPALTPSSLLSHVRNITHKVKNVILGEEEGPTAADIEAGTAAEINSKGKGKMIDLAWEAGDEKESLKTSLEVHALQEGKNDGDWWKLWDVGAECKEIGGMECYDGCHLAMIEQVISLTIFPTLIGRQRSESALDLGLVSYSTSPSPSLDLTASSQSGFVTRLFQALASEFDYMLKWELPVSTMVEFNEVGKATRVRDIVDVRDVIETFVPFAKRIGWFTRRLSGLVTSTMGSIAMALLPALPAPSVGTVPIKIEAERMAEKYAKTDQLGSAIGLGFNNMGTIPPPRPPLRPSTTIRTNSEARQPNSLGLQGIRMAPDVDSEGFET
ncbi:hypothetical protein BCR39DRAFT_530729 [Naematelia encephala]|uniref:Uncharacterized protein n=1 Tax=Naematelia encephala TaxID=71784 RepID=A0A1Y2B5C6_9TREE|nr:hypothetical protein BCR39DRAFT_530729 [Naematelia encephala]